MFVFDSFWILFSGFFLIKKKIQIVSNLLVAYLASLFCTYVNLSCVVLSRENVNKKLFKISIGKHNDYFTTP